MTRQLDMCSHAKVYKKIYCEKGHRLNSMAKGGMIDIKRLARGDPLALSVCKTCWDFAFMGLALSKKERGWIKKKEA